MSRGDIDGLFFERVVSRMLDADEVRASQGERESKCARRSRGGVDGCFIRTMRGYARVGDGRIVGIDDAARERDLSAGRNWAALTMSTATPACRAASRIFTTKNRSSTTATKAKLASLSHSLTYMHRIMPSGTSTAHRPLRCNTTECVLYRSY